MVIGFSVFTYIWAHLDSAPLRFEAKAVPNLPGFSRRCCQRKVQYGGKGGTDLINFDANAFNHLNIKRKVIDDNNDKIKIKSCA